jgi:hypothetical protein
LQSIHVHLIIDIDLSSSNISLYVFSHHIVRIFTPAPQEMADEKCIQFFAPPTCFADLVESAKQIKNGGANLRDGEGGLP